MNNNPTTRRSLSKTPYTPQHAPRARLAQNTMLTLMARGRLENLATAPLEPFHARFEDFACSCPLDLLHCERVHF
jgi:hypothetical protein